MSKDKDKDKSTKPNSVKQPQLPEGISLQKLKAYWNEASSAYAPAFKRARVIDATDRGRLWKAINAKFPKYQVLPDTNHVSYVKNNLLASLYSVGRSASLNPTSDNDLEITKQLNILLEHLWDVQKVPYFQMLAGERAALLNLGITQVGWDNSILKGTGDTFSKGSLTLKNIDPMRFMRDPFSVSLEVAAYCMTWDEFHKDVILRHPSYSGAKEFFATKASQAMGTAPVQAMTDQKQKPHKDYYRVITYWVQDNGKIHEIHTIDNEHVLHVKEDIKPSKFPFAELYCNVPAGDVIGTSEPSRVFANSVAYNLMTSIILTAEVKNQKPPKFVSNHAEINLRDFIQHGNDSDYTFVVQGNASQAVHYHQFPQPSQTATQILGTLVGDIQNISGVDGRYTGKDTGSILTTGGIEQMLDQATLVDQPKIVNYEHYTTQLTELVLGNLIKHGSKRKYFVKNPESRQYESIEVNFEDLTDDTVFDYALNISAHLPKNKQRIAQMANVIMEKQMQYNSEGQQGVTLMTPEEWLAMQDLPQQEYMLERMGAERNRDYVDKVSKVIFQYANLLETGMQPEDALLMTADAVQNDTTIPVAPDEQGVPTMQEPTVPEQSPIPMDF